MTEGRALCAERELGTPGAGECLRVQAALGM